MTGSVMNDIVQKLMAVKAGSSAASCGIQIARPVEVEEIRTLSRVPIEPMMMNGMKDVKASLMAMRYLLSPTTSATVINASSNFSPKDMMYLLKGYKGEQNRDGSTVPARIDRATSSLQCGKCGNVSHVRAPLWRPHALQPRWR